MGSNPFIINNVPIKKMSWGKRKGFIEVKLSDNHYNILYKGKAKLNNKNEVEKLIIELKSKGFDFFEGSSWF